MYWALFNGFSHFITRIKILLNNIQWLTIKNSNFDKEGLHLFLLSCYKCASLTVYVENLRSLRGAWKNYKFLSSEWWEKFEPPTIQNAMKFATLLSYIFISFWHTVKRCFTDDPLIPTPQYYRQFDLLKRRDLDPGLTLRATPSVQNSLFDYCIMFLYVTFLSMNDSF